METILHLSDLHFGWEGDAPSGLADREVCLSGLLNQLESLDAKWKPTIICITGDVAWKGSASDYVAARDWLDKLLSVCNLTYEQMVVCSGNHDIIRAKAKKIPRSESTSDADSVLEVPIAPHFEDQFSDYTSFYKKTGMPLLQFGDYESCLVGERTINGIRFTVLNSAWFSKDKHDKEKLWIGLPHIKYMEDKGSLSLISESSDISYTLLHHPVEMLHADEKHAYTSRENTWDYIAHRSHILLSGHTHGEVRKPDRIADQALHFTGGSTYSGTRHPNSFRLIQINGGVVDDKTFEFNPRSAKNEWKPHPAETRDLFSKTEQKQAAVAQKRTLDTKEYRNAFFEHAERHLEQKSRLLKQTGMLPATIDRPVSLRVSNQHNQYDSNGRLKRGKNAEHEMPFYQAVRESRRTLLLGDLGMGKSTLAAHLVTETISRSQQAIAMLIPVKSLVLADNLSLRDLIRSFDRYISDNIWLRTPKFDLHSTLETGIEVSLVLDGLDELARDVAARLLNRTASLVEHWSNIQVVCTARPVELAGASYSDWRVVHTVALDDMAKSEFIEKELIADGVPQEQLQGKKSALLTSLKEMASLDAIASSPLVIRLVFQQLKEQHTETTLTLGNLLHHLLIERLDGWQKRDDKPLPYALLEEMFPTPEQKALLLSKLAGRIVSNQPLSIDEAKALLEGVAKKLREEKSHQLASEAISFYEWIGLLTKSEIVEFPLQPLAEACAASGLLEHLTNGSEYQNANERNAWRVVSFMAAMARQRGQLDQVREFLIEYVTTLLEEPAYLPAACYIVAEADDCAIAEHAVKQIEKISFRPLTSFIEEQIASNRNIAKTLALAGDVGFDWFYKAYLDPRYPITNAGSGLVAGVFAEWAMLVHSSITPGQKEKISKLVLPYQATNEGHFWGVLTILPVLVPDAFSKEDLQWYQALALDHRVLSNWGEQQLNKQKLVGNSDESLNAILLCRSNDSSHAARMWLDWNPSEKPPYSITRLALRLSAKEPLNGHEQSVIDQCRERLSEKWTRFARWALAMEDEKTAAGAIKILFDAGEKRLAILGNAAMNATHDGGYIASAEKILSELVSQEGQDGVHWLANKIIQSDVYLGAHSGWWRILLNHIELIEDGEKYLTAICHKLGPYTIPRRPEVREAFARLLNGEKGSPYKKALRDKLKSLDPSERQGAAAILISSDPQSEAEALFVSIRSRAGNLHRHDRDEWDSFCLTLDFGPSVLTYLNSQLDALEPQSRTFALVILRKGGFDIKQHSVELLLSITDLGNWHIRKDDACREFLGSEYIYPALLEQLGTPNSRNKAAEALLEFHDDRIDSFTKTKCIALKNEQYFHFWEIVPLANKIISDPVFANDLQEAGESLKEAGEPKPILCLIAKALTSGTGWKDVVWQLLCADTLSIDEDEYGLGLLELGFIAQQHQCSIGEAAKECLLDPRMETTRKVDAYHWLGILSDEFVSLDDDELQNAIFHGRPIHYSATTALIARLGKTPEGFSCHRQNRQRPALTTRTSKQKSAPQIYDQLMNYARDSENIHPSLRTTLHECLYLPDFSESEVSKISAQGKQGILIETVLNQAYGREQKLEEAIPLLDLSAQLWRDKNSQFNILARTWNMHRDSVIFNGGNKAESYLKALDQALIDSNIWTLPLALEILDLCGSLKKTQIPLVFSDLSKHPTGFHVVLFARFCDWLSEDLDEEVAEAAVLSAENVIVALNEEPWAIKNSEMQNTWAYLLFPAVLWAKGKKTSKAANAVFLRGIQAIFYKHPNANDSPRTDLTKLLSKLDSLLEQAPPEILRDVIKLGANSLEPSISSFCRLISAFGEMTPN